MCIITDKGSLGDTTAFGMALEGDEQFFGYHNTSRTSRPNCMILQLPAASRLGRDNFVLGADMAQWGSDIFKMWGRRIEDLEQSRSRSNALLGALKSEVTEIAYGDYHLLVSDTPTAIMDVLGTLPPELRPSVRPELLTFYEQTYPGYSIILACFDPSMEAHKHPIMVRYIPQDPDVIYIPAIESHDGTPPKIGSALNRSHNPFTVVLSTRYMVQGEPVRYPGFLTPELRDQLPTRVAGFRDNRTTTATNSSYRVPVAALEATYAGNPLMLFQRVEEVA